MIVASTQPEADYPPSTSPPRPTAHRANHSFSAPPGRRRTDRAISAAAAPIAAPIAAPVSAGTSAVDGRCLQERGLVSSPARTGSVITSTTSDAPAGHASLWNRRCHACVFDGGVGVVASRAKSLGVDPGELRAEQKNLRRVVDPHEDHGHRSRWRCRSFRCTGFRGGHAGRVVG